MNPIVHLARKTTIKGCCDSFESHINRKCEHHDFECPDNCVRFYTDGQGNPTFGIPHTDGLSYYVIYYCPWCGKALQPIAAEAHDGPVKYTLVFNDGVGQGLVGIVRNADIRYSGNYGEPHFPTYLEQDDYPKLFNVKEEEICCQQEETVRAMLRKSCPDIQFDSHLIV